MDDFDNQTPEDDELETLPEFWEYIGNTGPEDFPPDDIK